MVSGCVMNQIFKFMNFESFILCQLREVQKHLLSKQYLLHHLRKKSIAIQMQFDEMTGTYYFLINSSIDLLLSFFTRFSSISAWRFNSNSLR